jgi:hypothetical protein
MIFTSPYCNCSSRQRRETIIFTNRDHYFFRSLTDRCVQTALPTADALSFSLYVELGVVLARGTRPWCQGQVLTHVQRPRTTSSSTSRARSAQTNLPPPMNSQPHPRRPRVLTCTQRVVYRLTVGTNLPRHVQGRERGGALCALRRVSGRVRWAYRLSAPASTCFTPGWCRYCPLWTRRSGWDMRASSSRMPRRSSGSCVGCCALTTLCRSPSSEWA